MAKKTRLEEIDVVRRENGRIHVLGRNEDKAYHMIYNAKTGEIIGGEDGFKPKFYPSLGEVWAGTLGATILGISAGTTAGGLYRLSPNATILTMLGGFVAGASLPFLNYLRPSVKDRIRETRNYRTTVKQFQEKNMADLREAVKDIRIYQGSISDLAKEIEREIERVDTGKPETFIQDKDNFWLRVKAHCLGADAIVNYQPGSSLGTPVKYVDKE